MHIRRLTLDDSCRDLAALHAQCFAAAWQAQDFETYLAGDSYDILGAFEKSKLLGFILTRFAVDQADIMTICVAPKKRGKRLGAKLLKASEDELMRRGADILFLDVAEDNVAAIALYKDAGYYQFGRRSGYYRRPDARIAALLFQKRLS